MAIKAVIWDLGGVLVRTEDWGPREKLAAELGLSRENLEEEMFGGEAGQMGMLGLISGEDHWQKLADTFGMERDIFVGRFFEGDQLDEDLIVYIASLKKQYKIALLSNALTSLRKALIEDWDILDLFDEVIISAEVGLVKPDAAIYQLALERLGLHAEEAIFVDDFARNIKAANQLGIHSVRFLTRVQAIRDLEQLLAID